MNSNKVIKVTIGGAEYPLQWSNQFLKNFDEGKQRDCDFSSIVARVWNSTLRTRSLFIDVADSIAEFNAQVNEDLTSAFTREEAVHLIYTAANLANSRVTMEEIEHACWNGFLDPNDGYHIAVYQFCMEAYMSGVGATKKSLTPSFLDRLKATLSL